MKTQKQQAPGEKRPYVKPAFKSARIYERLALGCNRKQGQSFKCNLNPGS